MAENRIDISLSAEERQTILNHIKTLKESMPFLIGLTKEQRQKMLKMSDKATVFVSKALELANQEPDFLPRNFDVSVMRRDVELYQSLLIIQQTLMQVVELIDDTTRQAGSEAYESALTVYQYAKNSRSGVEGLDQVVSELGKIFSSQGRKGKATAKPTT